MVVTAITFKLQSVHLTHTMIVYKKVEQLSNNIEKLRQKGLKIGFVPTMGALHNGHISLVELCKKANDISVCSIFVNPTQFNDPKDYEKYPVTIENDFLMLEKSGTDIVFMPPVSEIYPAGYDESQHYALDYLETILEGKYRPGHFQGVCKVMDRLLQIVRTDNLYLGQKDYQQCMVIRKLIELKGFNTKINISPTKREGNGLAMSSRNMRLSEKAKQDASVIYKSLLFIRDNIRSKSIGQLKEHVVQLILSAGVEKVDYVEICNANTLELIDVWDGKTPLVALCAAFIEGVRLIDNMLL